MEETTRRQLNYRKLTLQFQEVNKALTPELRTDLDGILWDLSEELAMREEAAEGARTAS